MLIFKMRNGKIVPQKSVRVCLNKALSVRPKTSLKVNPIHAGNGDDGYDEVHG